MRAGAALALADAFLKLSVACLCLAHSLSQLINLFLKCAPVRFVGANSQRTIALVLRFMAAIAQCQPVIWVKRQLWVRGLRFDVVSVQIMRRLAMPAFPVALFNRCRPLSQLSSFIHGDSVGLVSRHYNPKEHRHG